MQAEKRQSHSRSRYIRNFSTTGGRLLLLLYLMTLRSLDYIEYLMKAEPQPLALRQGVKFRLPLKAVLQLRID